MELGGEWVFRRLCLLRLFFLGRLPAAPSVDRRGNGFHVTGLFGFAPYLGDVRMTRADFLGDLPIGSVWLRLQ